MSRQNISKKYKTFCSRIACLLAASLMATHALSQDLSGWSDKTVCRLAISQQDDPQYLQEAKNRGLNCGGEVNQTQATSTSNSSSSQAAINHTPVSLGPSCNAPEYTVGPEPVSSDSVHRYYKFKWQDDPKICITVYEKNRVDDWQVSKIDELLNFAKNRLGLKIPVNAIVLDQKNSSRKTLRQADFDFCNTKVLTDSEDRDEQVENCVRTSDEWGNRSASAGVNQFDLPNGGDLFIGTDLFEMIDNNAVVFRIIMHEFFHIHQNSLKFYFEDKEQFGVPIFWTDNVEELWDNPKKEYIFANWIEEGWANFGGTALAAPFNTSYGSGELLAEELDECRNVINVAASKGDKFSLRDYEYQGGLYESSENPNNGIAREYAAQYSCGSWAAVYLWSLDERNFQKIMVDFWTGLAESENSSPGFGWVNSFESNFGMSLETFYKDFDAFMKQSRRSQISILKSDEEIIDAVLKL